MFEDKAPKTCEMVLKALPIKTEAHHSTTCGPEIWFVTDALKGKLPRENLQRAANVGEVGWWCEDYRFGDEMSPLKEATSIYYGRAIWDWTVGPVSIFAKIDSNVNEIVSVGKRILSTGVEKVTLCKK
jgi:hypothetical protein